MKRYFLGLAAGYSTRDMWRHTFTLGRRSDIARLEDYLGRRYTGQAISCKNGRSALCLALKAYFDKGDAVIVNGFTCYAVYEAVKAAGLTPVWADISREDLNFTPQSLDLVRRSGASFGHGVAPARLYGRSAPSFSAAASERSLKAPPERRGKVNICGIIVQNSLGNPVDIVAVEKFAKKHNLTIIEDLAHCAGVKYPDGREAGTVGAAAALSFGKEKAVDTVSGGAVVLRAPRKHQIKTPAKLPRLADRLRTRFYPLLGAMCRGLARVHLGGALMRCLVKIHWVEKSADNKLDLTRTIGPLEAKLALEQFKKLRNRPVREFALVKDRAAALAELKQAGYYFDGFWYERPVSPARYYKRVKFPEAECPVAVEVAEKIINLPAYYSKRELAAARKIIDKYTEEV